MQITEFDHSHLDEVVDVYSKVFAGPDWFEVQKCARCGRAYPGPVELRPAPDARVPELGMPCWGCAEPLELQDFYRDPADQLGMKIASQALDRADFAGFLARDGGELLGFTWGFRLPTDDAPSVRFSQASMMLAGLGYEPSTCFYAAEIGVVPNQQRRGVAELLARARFDRALSLGMTKVLFRTIDRQRLVGLYEKLFGAGNVEELFSDPDPNKAQIWFGASLDGLR